MPGFLWGSPEEKEREWAFAKAKLIQNGELLPNGTKLRRKDYPENLTHSFMIIDDRIIAMSGKRIYLGEGAYSHAKLAEDEVGHLIALKIITKSSSRSNGIIESHIASDLGIAGKSVTRTSHITKQYIAYQYLGISLLDYIRSKSLSLDKCYELCIKISLALHDIHTGRKAKSKTMYVHNDIHCENLVIDNQEEPHFIDFGLASQPSNGSIEKDTLHLLLLFFTPVKDRSPDYKDCIFASWMGEYKFLHEKPKFDEKCQQYIGKRGTIYTYVEPADKVEGGFFPRIHYMVRNTENFFQHGVVDLDDMKLTHLPHIKEDEGEDEQFWYFGLIFNELVLIQNKVLEVASQNNHVVRQKNRNEVLFNLLQDPMVFFRAGVIPSVLDIAETLTLCRFRLEAYQDFLKTQPSELRIEIIHMLNEVSSEILSDAAAIKQSINNIIAKKKSGVCIAPNNDNKSKQVALTSGTSFFMAKNLGTSNEVINVSVDLI